VRVCVRVHACVCACVCVCACMQCVREAAWQRGPGHQPVNQKVHFQSAHFGIAVP